MVTVGRNWSGGSEYRYGFNGKEQDPETYGDGNIYDYGFRVYDPRIGRFLSVDPKAADAPGWSPYRAFFCNPITYVDPDGQFEIDPNATRAERRAIKQGIREMRRMVRDKDVQAAVSKYGQMDLKQLKADFKKGQGPMIKVANLAGAYGAFTPNINSNVIRVDADLLKKTDEAKGEDKKDYKFLLGVTILHEDTHKGDHQDKVDYPGEEGELMETDSFKRVVDESNMKQTRKEFKEQQKTKLP